MESPFNHTALATETVSLDCERINKEFLLILGFLIFTFLMAISMAGAIAQSVKVLKPICRYELLIFKDALMIQRKYFFESIN